MVLEDHPQGLLYSHTTQLSAGFYAYKFFVRFENGVTRWVNDPCTRHGCHIAGSDNSGFVVGGNLISSNSTRPRPTPPLPERQIIYELMIDDFTARLPGDRSQRNMLDLVHDHLDRITDLGVTTVQPMPWTGVPESGFNWGYEPHLFFSVDERLTDLSGVPAGEIVNRLFSLRELIDALHERGVAIIMDGVFNHVRSEFPYLQLYQTVTTAHLLASLKKALSLRIWISPMAAHVSSSLMSVATGSNGSTLMVSASIMSEDFIEGPAATPGSSP